MKFALKIIVYFVMLHFDIFQCSKLHQNKICMEQIYLSLSWCRNCSNPWKDDDWKMYWHKHFPWAKVLFHQLHLMQSWNDLFVLCICILMIHELEHSHMTNFLITTFLWMFFFVNRLIQDILLDWTIGDFNSLKKSLENINRRLFSISSLINFNAFWYISIFL